MRRNKAIDRNESAKRNLKFRSRPYKETFKFENRCILYTFHGINIYIYLYIYIYNVSIICLVGKSRVGAWYRANSHVQPREHALRIAWRGAAWHGVVWCGAIHSFHKFVPCILHILCNSIYTIRRSTLSRWHPSARRVRIRET